MRAEWLDHGDAHMIFFYGDATVNWASVHPAKANATTTAQRNSEPNFLAPIQVAIINTSSPPTIA
jgi:hypothetical protein